MEISKKRFYEPEYHSKECTTYIARFSWKKLFIDCSNYIAIAICIVFILRRLDLLHFSLNNSGPRRSSIVAAKKSFMKSYFGFRNITHSWHPNHQNFMIYEYFLTKFCLLFFQPGNSSKPKKTELFLLIDVINIMALS